MFLAYNPTVWPAQLVLLLAALAVPLTIQLRPGAHRVAAGILGGLWLWTGVVYHLTFYTGVNRAAYVFAALFVAEGVLLVGESVSGDPLFPC